MCRGFLQIILIGSVILLAGCGQVVTPEPTRTPFPAERPTDAPATAVHSSPTLGPPTFIPDTVTPTITPTPIVHVVQKGDTLQAIAFDFGVSVEALQRANGVENPQFLQVGQRLVIPVDEETGQDASDLLLPTPTPHPIQPQGVAFYETPVDSLLGLGEIANTTAVTLTNVQIEVTLLDSVGEPLVESNTFVSMDIVPPGVRCPFSILFTAPPPDWAAYQVRVIRGQEAGALARAYVPISLVDLEGDSSGPQFQVTGTLKNASPGRVAESVEIFVTTYNAEGSVTGFRRAALTSEAVNGGLLPGEGRSFTVSLTSHAGAPDDFEVTALGRAAGG